ncbi:zinc-type alcohol dehydrogenase [Salmonella enterica subsp. enterica]|uniref:Zinc-type alcohol dehydrogenase n=1 Tax=Salmonella enterica I TaxID=59201 RepID=A0A3S4K342_SALET|nr:zinc-type alcohol dehydrogenase [Salmonella enterica subsp. enterica]
MGANNVVNSRDPEALKSTGRASSISLLTTVNVDLDWAALLRSADLWRATSIPLGPY